MIKLISPLTVSVMMVTFLLTLSANSAYQCDQYGNEPVMNGVDIHLDASLTRSEKDMIQNDFKYLLKLGTLASENSLFEGIFGGTSGAAVKDMLSERMKYIISEKVSIEKRLFVGRPTGDLLDPVVDEEPTKPDVPSKDEKGIIMAVNMGMALWVAKLMGGLEDFYFRAGRKAVAIETSRVGIVQIGKGYTMKKLGVGKVTPLVRIETLVHEARHSDCNKMFTTDDMEAFKAGGLPANTSCGHMHVKCPEKHDLSGAFACDDHVWGAYTIGGFFALQISKTCTTCSESETQQALMVAADSLNRVLNINDLLEGRAGLPDMTSLNIPVQESTKKKRGFWSIFGF